MSFRNVNNWHWVERDCTTWAIDYLKRHLACDFDDVKIAEIIDIEGDASISQRKGKVIAIYDLTAKTRVSQSESVYDCKIEICSESCGDDPIIHLIPSNSTLSRRISLFARSLCKQFSQDMIEEQKSLIAVDSSVGAQQKISFLSVDESSAVKASSRCKVKFSVSLPSDPSHLHKMLVDPEMINRWSSGSLSETSGLRCIYDGLVSFRIINATFPSVQMDWKLKEWNSLCEVKIELIPEDSGARALVTLQDIPTDFSSSGEEFFERYYWLPIKKMLGVF